MGGDPYADIDFDEINDLTNLAPDEIKCLKERLFIILSDTLMI